MIRDLSAVHFKGIGQGVNEQPPVYDKDGKPLDMNDPDLPIVKDKSKFTYYYWKMPKIKTTMLKFISEHWDYFNRTRFKGILLPAKFGLMRDVDANYMKKRGFCRYGKPCLIALSPNLFNAPHEGWVNYVLLHEMCHQAVYEDWVRADISIEYLDSGKTAHDDNWQNWMYKVGMPLRAKDIHPNDTYMDEKEKRTKQIYNDAFNKKLYRWGNTCKTGNIVAFHDKSNELKLGVAVGISTQKKRSWVVLYKPSVFAFSLVEEKLLLTPPDGFDKKPFYDNAKAWETVVDKLIGQKIAERVV